MVVATLEMTFPNDDDILDIVAEHREAFGIAEGAEKELEEAYRSASVGGRSWLAIDLAGYYFRHQRWKEAADVYREIAGPGMHGRLRLNYAVSLLNSGQICRAHELVSRTRLDEGFRPDLAEVEVRILEHIGDVEGANEILKTLVQRAPQHAPEYRVQIATNLYRRGKKAEAADVLKTVEKVELAKEPELLMQAAKLRHWLGLGDVLDYAIALAAVRGHAGSALLRLRRSRRAQATSPNSTRRPRPKGLGLCFVAATNSGWSILSLKMKWNSRRSCAYLKPSRQKARELPHRRRD